MDLTEVKKQLDEAQEYYDRNGYVVAFDRLMKAMRALVEEIENDDDRAWEERMGEDL